MQITFDTTITAEWLITNRPVVGASVLSIGPYIAVVTPYSATNGSEYWIYEVTGSLRHSPIRSSGVSCATEVEARSRAEATIEEWVTRFNDSSDPKPVIWTQAARY